MGEKKSHEGIHMTIISFAQWAAVYLVLFGIAGYIIYKIWLRWKEIKKDMKKEFEAEEKPAPEIKRPLGKNHGTRYLKYFSFEELQGLKGGSMKWQDN